MAKKLECGLCDARTTKLFQIGTPGDCVDVCYLCFSRDADRRTVGEMLPEELYRFFKACEHYEIETR